MLLLLGSLGLVMQGCGLQPTRTDAAQQDAEQSKQIKLVPASRIKPEYAQKANLIGLTLMAELAAQKGELPLAVASYLKAAKLSDDPKIAERATRVALFARDYKAAMQAAERWNTLKPNNLDVQHSLLVLYLRNKQIDNAAAAAENVLKLTPKGFGHLVALLNNENDKKSVMLLMDKVVAKHKTNAEAHFTYARLALQFKKYDLAHKHVNEALRLKPDYDGASSLLARVLMVKGETDKALKTMQALVKKHPKSMTHRAAYARLLAVARRYDKALKQFSIVLKKHPNNVDIIYAIALLTLEQRKLDTAESYFKRLLAMHKRVLESYYYLGNIEEQRKQYKKAISWYKRVEHGQNKINASIRVAQLLAKQGDIGAARDHLKKMHRRDASLSVRLYVVEIDILTDVGQTQTAMEVANNSLEAYPDNSDLLYARSMLAEKIDLLDLAEADLKTILKKEPDNVHALNALGYTLADRTNRYKEAYEYISKALKLAPTEAAILDSMGWVLYRMGNMQESIKYLRMALEAQQDDEIAAHLGEVLWVSGNKKEASKVWKKALKFVPDSSHIKKVMERFKP